MRSDLVVVLAPALDHDLRIDSIAKPLHRQALVAKLAVEGLVGAVLPGLPGSISAVSIRSSASHRRIARRQNSGPLSERRKFGAPCTLMSLARTSITRLQRMLPATSIASASRVNSSRRSST